MQKDNILLNYCIDDIERFCAELKLHKLQGLKPFKIRVSVIIKNYKLSKITGGNLDFTSRVICACFNQIMNFESLKWPPVATFKSWNNESALSFFNFALFHGQKQVLSPSSFFKSEIC